MWRISFLVAGLMVCGSGLLAGTAFAQQSYCRSIAGQKVPVGEARYRVTSGTHVQYANAYHDSGNELSLTESYPVGYMGANDTFTVTANAYIEDITASSCQDAKVVLTVWSKAGGSCSAGTQLGWTQFKVNTCKPLSGLTPSDAYHYYGGETLEVANVPKYSSYYYEISVGPTSGGTTTTDSGCFNVSTTDGYCI